MQFSVDNFFRKIKSLKKISVIISNMLISKIDRMRRAKSIERWIY